MMSVTLLAEDVHSNWKVKGSHQRTISPILIHGLQLTIQCAEQRFWSQNYGVVRPVLPTLFCCLVGSVAVMLAMMSMFTRWRDQRLSYSSAGSLSCWHVQGQQPT